MKKKKNARTIDELDFYSDDGKLDSLSGDELSVLKQSIEGSGPDRSAMAPHDTSDKAHLLRFIKKNKLVTASVIILLLSLIAGIAVGIFAIVSWVDTLPNRSDFKIIMGDNDPYTVPYEEAVRDGVLYVDMKKLAEYTDMTVSGSSTRLTFTASQGNYLKFENDSEYAFINGDKVVIIATDMDSDKPVTAKAIVSGDKCLVPYSFLTKCISDGLMYKLDTDKNSVHFKQKKILLDEDEPENAIAADILFHSANFNVIPQEGDKPEYTYDYPIDVSAYLDSITSEHLLLANKTSMLGEDYVPANLVELNCPTDGESQKLCSDAANALYAMMAAMKSEGIDDVFVTSSYRSYAYQQNLYNNYVNKHIGEGMSREEAEIMASSYSARPGQSEHQTGLCLDFTTDSIQGAVSNKFESTDAYTWLSANAYKYGFILRYPTDKVSITEYDYEPWHYRFVGREAATEIYFSGICLEEYVNGTAE